MNTETGSLTAFGAATLRAAHQLIDGEHKLLKDDIILQLLGHETCDYILNNKSHFFHPYSIGMRTHIVLRSPVFPVKWYSSPWSFRHRCSLL
jgi:hypothetical protein